MHTTNRSQQAIVSLFVILSLLLTAFPAGSSAQTPPPGPAAQEAQPIRLADSGTTLDAATTYRTQVTLRRSTDLARLRQLGVIVLEQRADRATVLVTEDQLETLARLRFRPRHTDQMAMLLDRAGLEARTTLAERTILALTSADTDGDGLTDTEEAWWCTDPLDNNSDSPNPPSQDNPSDGDEVEAILAGVTDYGPPFALWPDFYPYNPAGDCPDGDQDSVPDYAEELVIGLDQLTESTDGDKYDDGQELFGRTFCPGGAGSCGYGARPRETDDWLGPELPTWVLPPGNSPFVAAYPVIQFRADPATIRVVTKEIRTIERTVTQGEEISTGFAETEGHATTVGTIDTNTHSTWQEQSTTEGGIEPGTLAYASDPSGISSFGLSPALPRDTLKGQEGKTDQKITEPSGPLVIKESSTLLSSPLPQPPGSHFYLPWTQGKELEVYTQPPHDGTWAWDFKTDLAGTLLRASRPGTAYAYDGHTGFGCTSYYYKRANWVLIDHGDGTASLYLHIKPGGALVGKGPDGRPQAQHVEQGDPVAYSGNTGYSHPCPGGVHHLHFQVQKWNGIPTWDSAGRYYRNVFNYTSYKVRFEEYPNTDTLPSPAKSANPHSDPSDSACSAPSVTSGSGAPPALNSQQKPTGFRETIGQWFKGLWGKLTRSGSQRYAGASSDQPGCSSDSCADQVGSNSNTPLNFSDSRSDGQCGSGGGFYPDGSGYGTGGGGSGTAINDNGDGTFDRLRIWAETRTSGEGYSTSHSELRSNTTYNEVTRSQVNTLVSSEAWSTATTTDPTDAATLTFNYSLENVGSDLAVNLAEMDINILIGDLPVITWRAPDRSGIQPNQTVGPFGSDPIHLSLEQLAAIDNGAPIRIVLADYGYDDDLYQVDAWGRSVLFHVDDGITDGDRSVDTYLIATNLASDETYQDTMARYFDVEVFDAGPADPRTNTLTNIRTPEYGADGQISGWFDHPVDEHAWWELSISAGGETEGVSHFKDMPAQSRTDVYLRYLVDTDGDGYTDRAELDAFSDPNNADIHPRPLMIAAQHTITEGNTATVQLSLQNNGNFDASSVEVWAIAPNDSITLTDNLIGGGGRVRAGAQVVLGARIGAPDLDAWTTGTSKPYLGGQFEGITEKTYTFRVDTSGTVGNSAGLTVSWTDDGATWTPLDVGSGYDPSTWLDIAAGVRIAFTPGDISASETFTVQTALPIDTFSYLINNPSDYTPPIILVSYNDPQGNHKFSSDVEIAQIQDDLTPYQGQMHFGLQLDALSLATFQPGGNTAHLVFYNPTETTMTGAKLFAEFATPDGTVAQEYVLTGQTFLPGPNVVSLAWDTADFDPPFDPDVDYHLLVFATDHQGTIIENTVKDLDQLGEDKLPTAVMDTTTWDFGTVTQGTLLQTEIALANTGFTPLRAYADSATQSVNPAHPLLSVPPASFQTLPLTLDTADLPTGPYNDTITIRTSDPAHPQFTVNVSGTIAPLTGDALAHRVSEYRPWDQYVAVLGPRNLNDAVTFDHAIPDAPERMHPLYVYAEEGGALLGVGEYGPDFTGQTAPFGMFGDGSDGDLTVSNGETVYTDNTRSALASTAPAGQNEITLTGTSGFLEGKEVLIIQMQGTGVGNYEFGTIASINGNMLTLQDDLGNTFTVGGNSKAQVIQIPHYRNVTVQNGGTLTAHAWDSSTGGIVCLRIADEIVVAGALSAKGTGYQGGVGGGTPHPSQGYQGESTSGGGGASHLANPAGGGGGGYAAAQWYVSQGGGGGYGSPGANGGEAFGGQGGDGGPTYGEETLATQIFLGSGGGGGAWYEYGPSEAGTAGGGIILMFANTIHVTGKIVSDGADGGRQPGGVGADGGTGSGGSILFKTRHAELGSTKVTARGGTWSPGDAQGLGGVGRIRIEYCNSLTGATNPPASTQQLACYIARQLPGSPNTELTLPNTIPDSQFTRYQLQYGQRGAFAAAGSQDYTLTLPKRTYDTATLDALFENLNTSTFAFTLDVGADGSVEWSGNGSEQPVILSSPDLAAGLNTYLSAAPDPWGADVSIPIRVSLDTSGDVFLTNAVATPGGDSDPQVGPGDLAASDPNPVETDVVTLTATVHNPGRLPAENVVVSFFAGDPATDGVYLGSDLISPLPPLGEEQGVRAWDTTGYGGAVDVYVVLDAAGQLAELDEDNNSTSLTVSVQSRPDLQIAALTFTPPEGRESQAVTLTAILSNTGQTDAPAQTVAFYDGNPSVTGDLIGAASVAVPAGGQATVKVTWTASGKGEHAIYALADSDDQVGESREDNNTASAPLYVGLYDQVYLDSGGAPDPPYSSTLGYGYLSGEPVSWGSTPVETARWNADGLSGVQYQFDYLLTGADYHLDFTLYDGDGAGRVEEIWVDGLDTGVTISLTQMMPYYASLLLDPAFYQDHTVLAAVESGSLAGAVVSEIAVREIQYVYLDCGPDPALDPAYDAEQGYGYLDGYGSGAWGATPAETVRTSGGSVVQYRFDGLQAIRDYQVNLTFYEEGGSGRQQMVEIDGLQVGGPYTLGDTPQYVVIQAPPEAYVSDGSIVVGVQRTDGNFPVVSEIALEQRTVPYYDPEDDDWLGPTIGAPVFSDSVPSDAPLAVTASISDATTGGHGVSQATLLYGYETPYTQNQVAGVGPGSNGDGLWTFALPAQGDAHEGETLQFSLMARDGDDSPASSRDDNGGSYFALTIADEDTTAPTFSDPAPASVQEGQLVTLTLTIHDPSGVYDTAASDTSVYLEWDTDGEFAVDANRLDLDLLSGGIYQADEAIGPFATGTVVSWRVYAEDEDNSQAGGWSEAYAVNVGNGGFEIYLPLVLRGYE